MLSGIAEVRNGHTLLLGEIERIIVEVKPEGLSVPPERATGEAETKPSVLQREAKVKASIPLGAGSSPGEAETVMEPPRSTRRPEAPSSLHASSVAVPVAERAEAVASVRAMRLIRVRYPKDVQDHHPGVSEAIRAGERRGMALGYAGETLARYIDLSYAAGLLGGPRPRAACAARVDEVLSSRAGTAQERLTTAESYLHATARRDPECVPGVSLASGVDQWESNGWSCESDSGPGTRSGEPPELVAPVRRPEHLPQIPDYELVEYLGSGAFGDVYKARHLHLSDRSGGPEHFFAVKVVKAAHPSARDDLLREARNTFKVRHQNVVEVKTCGRLDDRAYVVMEYIDGPNGKSLLKNLCDHGVVGGGPGHLKRLTMETVAGTLGLRRVPVELERAGSGPGCYFRLVCWWFAGLAEGLGVAHEMKLVHHDIKPSNFMLDRGTGLLKLVDFGLSAATEGARERHGAVGGTRQYLAPERVAQWAFPPGSDEERDDDPRSDIWSLGVVLYEFITGKPAYEDTGCGVLRNIVTIDKPPIRTSFPYCGVPAALDEVCRKAFARDPIARHATARELSEELRRLAQSPRLF